MTWRARQIASSRLLQGPVGLHGVCAPEEIVTLPTNHRSFPFRVSGFHVCISADLPWMPQCFLPTGETRGEIGEAAGAKNKVDTRLLLRIESGR